jgi:hypothetical protein
MDLEQNVCLAAQSCSRHFPAWHFFAILALFAFIFGKQPAPLLRHARRTKEDMRQQARRGAIPDFEERL